VYAFVAQTNSLWGTPLSIQVFAASASGFVAPLQTIYPTDLQHAGDGGILEGITLDSAGTLYIAICCNPGIMAVYGTPLTAPTLLRSFTDTNLPYPAGMAVGGNEIYVTDVHANPGFASAVRAYPIMASGNVNPDRLIGYGLTLNSNQLTMLGHTLYLPQGSLGSTYFWISDNALVGYQSPRQILGQKFATIYWAVAGT
jgi:hypothetical protein